MCVVYVLCIMSIPQKETDMDNKEQKNIDDIVAILDNYAMSEGSRMKIKVEEGNGEVLSRQYHHGRCDVGSPWAKGEHFDVLE